MGHVEELGCPQQLRRLQLIAAQLRKAPLYGVGVRGVLVFNDGDGHAVDREHDVGAIALAGRRLEPPLPRDVQDVGPGRVEVYEPDLPVALIGLVVPLPLAAQPCQHLAVALNGGGKRLKVLDHRPDGILRHPWVEAAQGLFQHAGKQKPGLSASHGEGV